MTLKRVHHCQFPDVEEYDPDLRFVCNFCGQVWRQMTRAIVPKKEVTVGIWPFKRTETRTDWSKPFEPEWPKGFWCGAKQDDDLEDL